MSKIEVSPVFAAGINSRVFAYLDGGRGDQAGYNLSHTVPMLAGGLGGNYPYYYTWLRLMKGTPPATPTSTDVLARNSDTLVEWVSTNNNIGPYVVTNSNPILLGTWFAGASQSGTATWFWWYTKQHATNYNEVNNYPFYHEVIGTVGGLGSGTDLELAYPNIVAGNAYRIQNLQVSFPTSWTY
jgi:hypothetical protein